MDTISQSFEAQTPREAAALRALDRAYRENVHTRLHGIHENNGRISAWYGVEVLSGYRVQVDAHLTACDCKAGQVGLMCKHVAALADRAGCFDFLIEGFYSRAFGPSPVALDALAVAREEVARLARNPRSTADFFSLQNARAQLASFELVAA